MKTNHTAQEQPTLSLYQKLLLAELNDRPEILQLLKVIFDDYPKVFISEISCMKGVTNKMQNKGVELGTIRMKMESFIEEKIARLAGIDIDSFIKMQKTEDEHLRQLDFSTSKVADEITQSADQRALDNILDKASSCDVNIGEKSAE
jgi:hypothetical protein